MISFAKPPSPVRGTTTRALFVGAPLAAHIEPLSLSASEERLDVDPWATVEIWKVLPEAVDQPLEHLLAILDGHERRRVEAMRTEESRRLYAIAYACLRELLARKTGAEPSQVALARRGGHGKPAFARGGHGLTFNLSHTRGLILMATARGRELGIDVERCDRRVGEATLSRVNFTESELRELRHASPAERTRSFLQLWTRREAHAKMTGEGLGRVLARGRESEGPFGGMRSRICDLQLAPDHVGAVAVGLGGPQFRSSS
jgi:4'-phosphopantetheinyl transferase